MGTAGRMKMTPAATVNVSRVHPQQQLDATPPWALPFSMPFL